MKKEWDKIYFKFDRNEYFSIRRYFLNGSNDLSLLSNIKWSITDATELIAYKDEEMLE